MLALSGCGTPGDPTPPRPVVPEAVKDLAARQLGDSVVLTFSLPQSTLEGERLEEPPQIEIYRGFLPASAAVKPEGATTKHIYTIPAALVETYKVEGADSVAPARMRFRDPLKPEDVAQHSGEQAIYMVRTRASKRAASPDSNAATVRLFPTPERINDLAATLTETAIELRWTPPARTTSGAQIPALAGYRIYRAEVDTTTGAVTDPTQAALKTPPELIGVSPSASYRDADFEFGRAYLYTVRSVAQHEADSVESDNSASVVVTPRDTFPPAPPQNAVAIVLPATAQTPPQVELSWSISPEPDLAGYHVYRSEKEGERGERLNRELLLTPTFRDISVSPGRRYFYTVTALDRAGNESAAGVPVSAEIP